MEFKKVVIIGAGAVGCYILWGLSQKENIELSVIASGKRKERFERDGFFINDDLFKPVVKTPSEAYGADLVIVAVKYNALQSVVSDIKEIVTENTVVMSLMNGVDSEEVIASAIGEKHIVPALIKVASERKENRVFFDPDSTIGIVYGEKDGKSTERTEALARLFEETGLHYRETDVIWSEIWSKFRLNVGNNQPQAMLGVGVGAYSDSEHVAAIREGLVKELDAIAEAKEIDISKADSSSFRGSKVSKRARYSTLQDLDAGRHTEVDMFSGTLIRMGKELGIPTPYNEITYHMIKALEEKNDGFFDYE
ncbi:ketopantoate reductase family protein [Butyrivibrio sp. YAB3001]|uniref:ketopantoate reductase family protein n=1 Tax=Butyrivibrio sp. YAB3001 TaxID=1520812 RepID=UPI0008F65337|nr:ketopantoate reductase family protein [Butyrivibrio sp. YAB3001]SFC29445.1 2-dehydropantoate 2-reductase [Butyrivibrio sp. YAB3001]